MQKGFFITDTFNEANPTINMENWIEPTIYNNGDSIVSINGMILKPTGIFRVGPAGVEMNGPIHLFFPEEGKHDIKVSYTVLQKSCLTQPPA
jgi:hypothetical protein